MNLRKTIRTILESVLVESEGKNVTCQNCFHSWEKTPSDKNPYLIIKQKNSIKKN
jgi:hypothetical protein